MTKERFIINGDIKLSEIDNDKPYIELTTRLCYLDDFNANGIGLSSKANQESFNTLIDMPIVAKINNRGNKFGSHEAQRDKDGNIIGFGTSAYGTHTEVWVEEDEVEIPNKGKLKLPCLFAKSKVWKRFENVCNLIENKIKNPEKYNGGLYSSWELVGDEYELIDGKKMYKSFTFLSNCLIDVMPAYFKNSKTLAVAEQESNFENDLSQAFKLDNEKINNEGNGGNEMTKKIEQSALNTRDLAFKLSKALNPKGWDGEEYFSIQEMYPEEKKVMCVDIFASSTDEVCVFPYTVSENDEVMVGECTRRKISELIAEKQNVNIQVNLDDTAKLLSEKEIKISDLEKTLGEKDTKISELEDELSQKVDAMVKISEKVANLETEIAELQPLKAEKEEAQRLAKEAELSEKKEALKVVATKGGYITSEELETSEELKALIDNLDEKGIKAIVADRFIASLDTKETEKDTEVSEVETKEKVKTDLNNDENMISSVDIIKRMFGTKK